MARKASIWHVDCYEKAKPGTADGPNDCDPGAVADGAGGGDDQGQDQGQAADRMQDDGVTPGGTVPDGAGDAQGDGDQGDGDQGDQGDAGDSDGDGNDADAGDSDDDQTGDGQNGDAMSDQPPKATDQVCPILFDSAKMQKHLHREDLYEILRDGFGGYNLSALNKSSLADKIVSCMQTTRAMENDPNADQGTYSMKRNIQRCLRTDDVLRKVLKVTARPAAEDQTDTARAQQQAQKAMDDALKARADAVEQAEKREAAEQAMAEALAEAEAAKQAAKDADGRIVKITMPDGQDVKLDGRHHTFPKLAQLVAAGIPVMIVGPAGGGKTEACRSLALDLDRQFMPLSLGPQTTQASLFGYTDATGQYVRTPFREAFENGGLILLDEFDRCNERVSVTLNAAVAQRYCAFPDGTVHAHKDCVIVAAANTTGHGADRQYVSARQQDAATLDRFAVLDWQYDEQFEEALTLAQGLEQAEAIAWLKRVRKVRQRVAELALRYLVSPRAAIQGAALMATGADQSLAEDTILFRGWNAEDRAKVEVQ
jgi:cobaltochelatase CobS